jgi:glycosyltransferase involved in cell wall biosynthesis
LIAKAFKIRYVYHIRFGRVPAIAASGTLEWKLIRSVMRLASVVIVLDETTEKTVVSRVPGARVKRIPNCVDFTEMPEVGGLPIVEPRAVVFVGWVVRTKGIEDLLAAWAVVSKPGWTLLIVGSCEAAYRNFLESLVTASQAVKFLGELPHSEVLQVMALGDVFVLPSHTEGFPNAVLEAMALRKAVVATDVGAVGEMLSGGCGLVVTAAKPAELAAGLSTVMEDLELRRRLGDSAHARAQAEYSVDNVLSQYMRVWAGV